jgi:hypothetical protein
MLLALEIDGTTARSSGISGISASGACASARVVDGVAYPRAGHCGQWLGALKAGVLRAVCTMRANIASVIKQWWAPLRRQQAGRDESSPSKVAASGPKPKRRTNRMERARRISPSYYMNFGVVHDSGKDIAIRYHRCISNFPLVD